MTAYQPFDLAQATRRIKADLAVSGFSDLSDPFQLKTSPPVPPEMSDMSDFSKLVRATGAPPLGQAESRAACPNCGETAFWTNAMGAVLCRSCIPPPTPEDCLTELEELVRLHAGVLFQVVFESNCCWIAHGLDGRSWPDAYIAAVFKGCEPLLDANLERRERLRRLQAQAMGRRAERA